MSELKAKIDLFNKNKKMKKITEYKKLDAATFDSSRLPLGNCVFWDEVDIPKYTGTLIAIEPSSCSFTRAHGSDFNSCAEVLERYPRDVPVGVAPLPDDKPFLAYVGLGGDSLSKKGKKELCFEKSLWALDTEVDFWFDGGTGHNGTLKHYHYAIDVSTEWAAKNYPELVEAMEYKPIFAPESDLVIGHQIGSELYDEYWYPLPERLKAEGGVE